MKWKSLGRQIISNIFFVFVGVVVHGNIGNIYLLEAVSLWSQAYGGMVELCE